MSRSYTSSPPVTCMMVAGQLYFTFTHRTVITFNRAKNYFFHVFSVIFTLKNVSYIFYITTITLCEPGSSVSTVSGYRLDDWVFGVQSPAEGKGLFL
jgi:hypothetical protein